MGILAKRTITGVALVLVITAASLWSDYSFIFLLLAINLLSLLEFYRLFGVENISPAKLPGAILSTAILITFAIVISRKSDWQILLVNIPLTFGIFIIELYRRANRPFHNLALTFLGILCVTIPLCFFIGIAFLPFSTGKYHYQVILGYFLILWTDDTLAYFSGKAFGKHPLFKRISPGKTWEGSVGGALSAIFIAYLLSGYFNIISTKGWISLALIIIVAGTLGDLIKSLMKRSLGAKDSGAILPGHGGMLDRFDSLLGSSPFVFSYLLFIH